MKDPKEVWEEEYETSLFAGKDREASEKDAEFARRGYCDTLLEATDAMRKGAKGE